MAGDWIKMRVSLWTHPKVVTLSSQLCVTRAHAIGALHCAWSIADQHADENGRVNLTPESLDQLTETKGFSSAMIKIGWIVLSEDSMQFVNYQEHNSTTAKKRADAQNRQRLSRTRHKTVTTKRDKSVTREEKRREEKNTPQSPTNDSDDFGAFWSVWPKKVAKEAAIKAWRSLAADGDLVLRIVADVAARSKSVDWTKEDRKYVPNPASYLNGRRWEDELPKSASPETDPELARRYAPPEIDP